MSPQQLRVAPGAVLRTGGARRRQRSRSLKQPHIGVVLNVIARMERRAPAFASSAAQRACLEKPLRPLTGITLPSPEQQQSFLSNRIRRSLAAWQSCGASQMVLSWLRHGYPLPWSQKPLPFHQGVSLANATPAQQQFLRSEIQRYFDIGAMEPAACKDYVTRCFLVPKPVEAGQPPKWRLVVDLRWVNAHLNKTTMRMETLKQLHMLARPDDYFLSLDLQDGFYAVPVRPADRKYLTLQISGVGYVQFAALPMGLACSPYAYCKTMKVFTAAVRSPSALLPPSPFPRSDAQRPPRRLEDLLPRFREVMRSGVRCLPYVDDYLFLFSSREAALAGRAYIEALLSMLGLARNPKKGCWEPTQRLEQHLGLGVDSHQGVFFIPPAKKAQLEEFALAILKRAGRSRGLVPKRLLAAFVGKAQALHLALPPARFMLRSLHLALNSATGWDTQVRLCTASRTDLQWFCSIPTKWDGRALFRSPETAVLHCDASTRAWGGVLNSLLAARGSWSASQFLEHITSKELRAVFFTVQCFLPQLRGRTVLLHEDNQAVVAILTSWTSKSPLLMKILRKLWWMLDVNNVSLQVVYIRTAANVWADALSRTVDTGDLHLPRTVFTQLEHLWGPHSMDRFADPLTTQLPRFNSQMAAPGSLGVDAFAQPDWRKENNFCFPPVNLLPRLARLLWATGAQATVVAPRWPAQSWYQLLLEASSSTMVLQLDSPLLRRGADGQLHPWTATWPLMAFRIPCRCPGLPQQQL